MAFELSPRIVVIGVGGAGGNAVNNMIEANLQGVEFVVANTDAQALTRSKASKHIQLGVNRTEGLGAGANPEVGAEAAKESSEEIRKLLQGAHMCFIAAGMGGGTGTGAAPIIARIAREQKVLTVGVVTKPFDFEGKRRMSVAERGIADLRSEVDTLIIIPNQNLFRIASRNTTFAEAFHMADRVLYSGVRGITDLMVMPGLINLDFADVRTVMAGMGTAMMGTGEAEGEDRALTAARAAIANPLLDDVSMKGARGVLINITGGRDMTLFEVDEAANEIRREVDPDGHLILGSTFDEAMEGRIRVSVVAAGVSRIDLVRTSPIASVLEPAPTVSAVLHIPEGRETIASSSIPDAPAALPQEVVSAPIQTTDAPARPTHPIIRTPVRPTHAKEEESEEVEKEIGLAPAVSVSGPSSIPPGEPHSRAFGSLFGGFKAKSDRPVQAAEDAPAPVPDDKFDNDLEIPAFLRRSSNT
ncbi:MAG: cell division protein FtsZ [Alphaproteobacteria bacterium]|nr:cell division protein FtsZ [Alphaproteobacteria bacterium]